MATTATSISKIDAASALFAGQGDLIIFDAIDDYSTADFDDLDNPKSLGQIVEDSSNWTGDDVSVEEIKDEQGNLITATVSAGTLAFEVDAASVSANMLKLFLNAADITSPTLGSVFSAAGTTVTAVGFGTSLPVITRPIAWLNDEQKRLLLFPKAKITSNFSNADGLMRIHISVLAEAVDTTYLKTGMIFDSNKAAVHS